MQKSENKDTKLTTNTGKDNCISFKVILKYWKKESKQLVISLSEKLCPDPTTFLKALKKHLDIKNEHCLEEVWIMQDHKDYEKKISWVKEIHGRIKINIPVSYKEQLIKSGNKQFEDPHYSEKKDD